MRHSGSFCESILPALQQREGRHRPVLDPPHLCLINFPLNLPATTATAAEVHLHNTPGDLLRAAPTLRARLAEARDLQEVAAGPGDKDAGDGRGHAVADVPNGWRRRRGLSWFPREWDDGATAVRRHARHPRRQAEDELGFWEGVAGGGGGRTERLAKCGSRCSKRATGSFAIITKK
jgi:hypothetical protein